MAGVDGGRVMEDALELRRTIVRRETEIYVLGGVYLAAAAVSVWWTARLWVDVVPALADAAMRGVLVLLAGAMVVTFLMLVVLWCLTPYWQLILLPGRPDDVVLRADREGLVATDAGYTVQVPWSSVASLRIEPWRPDTPALVTVVVVAGPVSRSKDPLARFVVRGLRKGTMRFGLGVDDPSVEEVRHAVPMLSAGRHSVD